MWPSWRKFGIAVALVATLVSGAAVQARESAPVQQDAVALAALPREAQITHSLILAGGPFPYDKDGSVFGNRERQLPPKARGYYREYTVKTPGARNRGARRLVCGGKPPTNPDVCYYTDDHYASFKRVQR
jgi:ribonuclease T1